MKTLSNGINETPHKATKGVNITYTDILIFKLTYLQFENTDVYASVSIEDLLVGE